MNSLETHDQELNRPVYDLDSHFDSHSGDGGILHSRAISRSLCSFFVVTQKKLRNLLKKKSREQLTLMIVPHNQNKIKNYNISNLSLTIFLGTIAFLLVFGSILIINHTSTLQEVDKLKRSQKDSKIQFMKIRNEVHGVSSDHEKVKALLSDIVKLTGGKESLKDIYYGLGGAAIPISELKDVKKQALLHDTLSPVTEEEEDISEEESIPMEIFVLNRIINDMNVVSHELDYLDNHTKRNLKSIRNSPTLWPAKGYITNPFGFIRKASDLKASFNTGFDITIPPGAKVVATAPGSINSVIRGKNSLLTVWVKHHYGYKTVYYGLSELAADLDAPLAKGDSIGYMGAVAGPGENTLHYEIHIGTEAQDPAVYLYSPQN